MSARSVSMVWRCAGVLGAIALSLLLAVLPLWLGLPLWLAAVVAAWFSTRAGADSAAERLLWCSQAGLLGVAVEIGRQVGHGAVGVLAGLVSVLLLATSLALLSSRRVPGQIVAASADWDPYAEIGPPANGYVLHLQSTPADMLSRFRQVPGLDPAVPLWLADHGLLLPADEANTEQAAMADYALLAGNWRNHPGLWLLSGSEPRLWWLPRWQLAGWRDQRPWFEPLGGGRLSSLQDRLAAASAIEMSACGPFLDACGLLPTAEPAPAPPASPPGMPSLRLQREWPPGLDHADPLWWLRQARYRLWIGELDSGHSVTGSGQLAWQAEPTQLLIRDAQAGPGPAWTGVWQSGSGVQWQASHRVQP